jgi:hypothetical protein
MNRCRCIYCEAQVTCDNELWTLHLIHADYSSRILTSSTCQEYERSARVKRQSQMTINISLFPLRVYLLSICFPDLFSIVTDLKRCDSLENHSAVSVTTFITKSYRLHVSLLLVTHVATARLLLSWNFLFATCPNRWQEEKSSVFKPSKHLISFQHASLSVVFLCILCDLSLCLPGFFIEPFVLYLNRPRPFSNSLQNDIISFDYNLNS